MNLQNQETRIANKFSVSKKVILITLFALGSTVIVNAQTAQEVAVRNDIKTLNHNESSVKKEKKKDVKSFDKKITVIKEEKQNVKRELRDLKAADVNEYSKAQFKKDFANIQNVQWKKTNGFDEGILTKAGIKTSAFYDTYANLVGTTTMKIFADLPNDAQKAINKEYKGYATKEIVYFDDNENNDTNMIIYNFPFEDVDSYFVQLTKDNKNIAVQVRLNGAVSYFTQIK